MLNHEGTVVAEHLGFHVVFDEISETLGAVNIDAAALRLSAAKKPKFH